jgi:molybdenum cofactor cytidylyltransferase
MGKIEAVVLAAGASRRYGEANKLLEPLNGSTVLGCVIRSLEEAGIAPIVVTGCEADRIQAAIPTVRTVLNPLWEEGMGTSLAAGVAATEPDSAVMIVLGDMPGLRPQVIHKLIEALDGQSVRIVVPVYDADSGRFGHPVLFGSGFRSKLLQLSGDEGARRIIRDANDVVMITVMGCLADIDRPEDLHESQC